MQTYGRTNGKADAGNALLQREADALAEVQAGQSLKLRLIVDADSVSDEWTSKSLSSGEAEFCVLNLGCRAGGFVMDCWSGMQLEHNVDGHTERIGLIDCQRSSEEVQKEDRSKPCKWTRST